MHSRPILVIVALAATTSKRARSALFVAAALTIACSKGELECPTSTKVVCYNPPAQARSMCDEVVVLSDARADASGGPFGDIKINPRYSARAQLGRTALCQRPDGVADGPTVRWYENGKLHSRGAYRDGQPHGRWTTWDDNGKATTFNAGDEPERTH